MGRDLAGAAGVLLAQRALVDELEGSLGVLGLVVTLAATLDRWVAWWVAEAREQGASWSDVGDALGTSKQAAWKTYGTGQEGS